MEFLSEGIGKLTLGGMDVDWDGSLSLQFARAQVFVLGATGAGKTSFIKYRLEEELPPNHMGFVRSAVHVNADDLRSELVGGYAIYSALVNQKADFPPQLVAGASFLRAKIQKKVLESAVDFLGDSLTVPAFVTQEFLDKNFDVRIFHIEIEGSSDAQTSLE